MKKTRPRVRDALFISLPENDPRLRTALDKAWEEDKEKVPGLSRSDVVRALLMEALKGRGLWT